MPEDYVRVRFLGDTVRDKIAAQKYKTYELQFRLVAGAGFESTTFGVFER